MTSETAMSLRQILAIALLLAPAIGFSEPLNDARTMSASNPEVEAALQESHPRYFYAYSARTFGEGKKDEAVMWYYVGELRYRFLLGTGGKEAVNEDQGMFALFRSTVGKQVLEWAGGSPTDWAKAIDAALKWDDTYPDPLVSKLKYFKEYAANHREAMKQRDQILADADKIREQRTARGLANR